MRYFLGLILILAFTLSVEGASRRSLLQATVPAASGGGGPMLSATNSLIAWWEPPSLATNDGSGLAYLADLSTNGVNLSMDDTAKRPLFTNSLAELNGHPIIWFDANTSALTNLIAANKAQPFVVCAAFTLKQDSNSKYLLDGRSGSNRNFIYASITEQLGYYSLSAIVNGNANSVDLPYVLTTVFTGSNSYSRTNGVAYASGNPGTASWDGFTLGNRYLLDDAFLGPIGAVIVINGTNDMPSVETYLIEKFLP